MGLDLAAQTIAFPGAAGGIGYAISHNADPTAGAGLAAPSGTMVVRTDVPEIYIKRAAPDWAWYRSDGKPPWSWDDVAGIGCPVNASEWDRVLEIAGLTGVVARPGALWLCQDEAAGGVLADAIGTFPLTGSGTVGYRVSTNRWSRLGVRTFDNINGAFTSSDAGLPDISTTGCALFCYGVRTNAGAVTRQILGMGTTQMWCGGQFPLRVVSGANVATGTITTLGNQHQVFGIVSDVGAGRAVGYDMMQKVSPPVGAVTGKRLVIGGVPAVVTPGANDVVYAWSWFSAPTDAQIKTILMVLGWNPQWI